MIRTQRELARRLATLALALGLAALFHANAQRLPSAENIAQDPVLGAYLVNAEGFTLYARQGETPARLLCSGTCLSRWLPAEAVAAPAAGGAGALAGLATMARPDGQVQATYAGQPLYRSAADRNPGDVSSNGVDGQWFVVNAQPVVHVFHHPTMGDILVGPTGMTLYVFDYDTKTGYECDEGCAENFPPLVVTRGAPAAQNVRSAVPAALRGGTDTMERSPDSWHGARVQVRYHGKPLYYWFRDEQPGDVSGDGIAGLWQVARP